MFKKTALVLVFAMVMTTVYPSVGMSWGSPCRDMIIITNIVGMEMKRCFRGWLASFSARSSFPPPFSRPVHQCRWLTLHPASADIYLSPLLSRRACAVGSAISWIITGGGCWISTVSQLRNTPSGHASTRHTELYGLRLSSAPWTFP